jgi:hypothetical protein
MSGKGDKLRPVNASKYAKNFEKIFGPDRWLKKKQKKELTHKKNPVSLKHEDKRNKKR